MAYRKQTRTSDYSLPSTAMTKFHRIRLSQPQGDIPYHHPTRWEMGDRGWLGNDDSARDLTPKFIINSCHGAAVTRKRENANHLSIHLLWSRNRAFETKKLKKWPPTRHYFEKPMHTQYTAG